ncbi:MAG: cytidylate kinase family protein [Candidatus Woesearchaeota archaeon]
MIITISGRPGAGKSSVAKRVAAKLGMKHYSMGDLQRSIAKEKGVSLAELSEMEERDKSIDKEVDRKQEELGKREDNFVIDSRIGFHFIPQSVKVFLDVDPDTGAGRIYREKRDDERFSTLEKTEDELKSRVASEKKRYMEYYNTDHHDMSNYDIVIDTTDMSIEETADEVMKRASEFESEG